jgi:hypothetical protein
MRNPVAKICKKSKDGNDRLMRKAPKIRQVKNNIMGIPANKFNHARRESEIGKAQLPIKIKRPFTSVHDRRPLEEELPE